MVNGILGKKLGMTRIFTEEGRWIDVTVLEAGPCTVVQRKTEDRDGYEAVQLGYGAVKEKHLTKPVQGHFKGQGVTPQRKLREFRVAQDSELKPGDTIKADIFAAGERVDIAGTSKGKGFQGVIKRHGMKGGPGAHGSHFHREPGSVGQSTDPGKIIKGKRLPGQMGNVRVTVQNIEIVSVDAEKNLILVRGAVPGAAGGMVQVSKSVKGAS